MPLLCPSPGGGWGVMVLRQREEQACDKDISRQRDVDVADRGELAHPISWLLSVRVLDFHFGKDGLGALFPNPLLNPTETRGHYLQNKPENPPRGRGRQVSRGPPDSRVSKGPFPVVDFSFRHRDSRSHAKAAGDQTRSGVCSL